MTVDVVSAPCAVSLVNPALADCEEPPDFYGGFVTSDGYSRGYLALIGSCAAHRELVEAFLVGHDGVGPMVEFGGVIEFLASYHEDRMCDRFPLGVMHVGCHHAAS